jgi:hypothetical protein
LSFTGDEEAEQAGIVGAVAQLLLDAGDHLWGCTECHRPFVATRQQAYCSPKCSQRVRNRNRPKRPRKRE